MRQETGDPDQWNGHEGAPGTRQCEQDREEEERQAQQVRQVPGCEPSGAAPGRDDHDHDARRPGGHADERPKRGCRHETEGRGERHGHHDRGGGRVGDAHPDQEGTGGGRSGTRALEVEDAGRGASDLHDVPGRIRAEAVHGPGSERRDVEGHGKHRAGDE
jgi:hypothetical protein